MSALFSCSQHSLSEPAMGNIFQTEENLNKKTAPGLDGIPQRVLKDCKLSGILCDILNTSFQEEIIPPQ